MQFFEYADESRAYISREPMYAQPYVDVFQSILETCLHADPTRRVANATDMLNPWTEALKNDFHLANNLAYQEPVLFLSYRSGSRGPVDYFERAKTCARYDLLFILGW
jgi:hypothetical protein